MDLLFRNFPYFIETYFSFSPVEYTIVLSVVFFAFALLFRKHFRSTVLRWIYIVLFSVYLATLIGITLLSTNRADIQMINLNPIININDKFGEMGVHRLRGCISNVVLFIPFGALTAIIFRHHKLQLSLLTGMIVSVIIETLQYVLRRGCSETMDVICNTAGAFLGALMIITVLYIIKTNSKHKE